MSNIKLNPLSCMGGKFWAIETFTSIIEYCAKTYCLKGYLEITGGGGKIMANLNPYLLPHRIYNEKELGVANFIATLCDKRKTRAVINTIEQLIAKYDPKSLFALAYGDKDDENIDMVLSAAYTFIVTYGSNSTDREKFFENQFKKEIINNRKHLNLTDFNPIFKGVTVTCGDCFYYLKEYKDREDCFIFIDPPYVGTASYKNSFTTEKHKDLVNLLIDCKVKVMLCGYSNAIYKELEIKGWSRYLVKEIHVPSSKSSRRVKEYIWTNFQLPISLLDAS